LAWRGLRPYRRMQNHFHWPWLFRRIEAEAWFFRSPFGRGCWHHSWPK